MNAGLWKVIADIGIEFHPDRVQVVARKIASLSSVDEFSKAVTASGSSQSKAMLAKLQQEWRKNHEITPLEIAAALRGASGTASIMEKREAVEMVWTGPFTGLVASRHTEQVLLEVIESARRRLFIVSFVAYDINSVIGALRDAVGRNVRIDLLLESSKSHGGRVDIDSIDTFKKKLPSANVYAWTTESKSGGDTWSGAVHAKCAVADRSMAFITSANLTRAAMEKNMELGVLVRGGNLPGMLEDHLDALVTTRIVEKI